MIFQGDAVKTLTLGKEWRSGKVGREQKCTRDAGQSERRVAWPAEGPRRGWLELGRRVEAHVIRGGASTVGRGGQQGCDRPG